MREHCLQCFGMHRCSFQLFIGIRSKKKINILEYKLTRCHPWITQSDSKTLVLVTRSPPSAEPADSWSCSSMCSIVGYFGTRSHHLEDALVQQNLWSSGLCLPVTCFQPWLLSQSSLLHPVAECWYPGHNPLPRRMQVGMGMRECWGARTLCGSPRQGSGKVPLEEWKYLAWAIDLHSHWKGAWNEL